MSKYKVIFERTFRYEAIIEVAQSKKDNEIMPIDKIINLGTAVLHADMNALDHSIDSDWDLVDFEEVE